MHRPLIRPVPVLSADSRGTSVSGGSPRAMLILEDDGSSMDRAFGLNCLVLWICIIGEEVLRLLLSFKYSNRVTWCFLSQIIRLSLSPQSLGRYG
jgi:hypothetical protein